jgi:hypothetical protein
VENKQFRSVFIVNPFPQTHVKIKGQGLELSDPRLMGDEPFPVPFYLLCAVQNSKTHQVPKQLVQLLF